MLLGSGQRFYLCACHTFSVMHCIMSRGRIGLLIVPVVVGLAACGPRGALGGTVSSGATPTPALATPGPGISADFLAAVNSDGFYVTPAPADANPAISQADAEALVRNDPFTHGFANASMLGQCVAPGRGNTATKTYLCWVVDGTSHLPNLLEGNVNASSPGPNNTTIYKEIFVIVDAQPGSATAGTIVTAAGIDGSS